MSDTLAPTSTTTTNMSDPIEPSATEVSPKKRSKKANNSSVSENLTVTLPVKSGLLSKQKKPSQPKQSQKNEAQNVADWMDREYRGISIYAVLMGVLLTLILWTGISTVRQIQAYHHQYTDLQKAKKEYRNLQIEHQRLLIEQQTFSATPQIARRAVTELNMFYPKLSDRMIIQQPAPSNAATLDKTDAQATQDSEVAP